MNITAKVQCSTLSPQYANSFADGGTLVDVGFIGDYADGRNKAWNSATPVIEVKMTVNGTLAGTAFVLGRSYTLTFEPDAA